MAIGGIKARNLLVEHGMNVGQEGKPWRNKRDAYPGFILKKG
jgi:hypothetical protein